MQRDMTLATKNSMLVKPVVTHMASDRTHLLNTRNNVSIRLFSLVGEGCKAYDITASTRHDETQRDMTWRDMTQRDMAQRDMTQRDMTQRDMAQRDMAQRDMAQRDMAQRDVTRRDMVQRDMTQRHDTKTWHGERHDTET